jgi:hypothetical protein
MPKPRSRRSRWRFAAIALFALLAFAYVHRLPKLAVAACV